MGHKKAFLLPQNIVFIPDLQHVIPGVPGEQPGGEHYGEAGVALPWGGGGPGGQGLIPGQTLQGLKENN